MPNVCFNPNLWPTPKEQGASEYTAIYEHAMSVWDSNPDRSNGVRGNMVRGSLLEMNDWLKAIQSGEAW